MTGDFEELAQPVRRDAQRQVVYQRMEIQHVGIHQAAVQREPDPVFSVIDYRERADRAGTHTKKFEQTVGTAKRQSVRADLVLQCLQVDLAILLRNDQKIPFLAVTQIQVCLLYTSPSPRDRSLSRMPSSA